MTGKCLQHPTEMVTQISSCGVNYHNGSLVGTLLTLYCMKCGWTWQEYQVDKPDMIYCRPDQLEEARKIVDSVMGSDDES